MKKRKVLVVDASSAGISGDMFVSSLIDLGAPQKNVLGAMKTAAQIVDRSDVDISIEEIKMGGFRCKRLSARYREGYLDCDASKLLEDVKAAAKSALRTRDAVDYAYNAVKLLVEVEALLHGTKIDEVHLHETGSVDTILEVIGAASALERLQLFGAKVYVTPVAVGGGLVRFSHGVTPAPAPAALQILTSKKIAFHGGPVEQELTTPTGATLLAALDPTPTRFYPPIIPLRIGFGAGLKEIENTPNILRVILGEDLYDAAGDIIVQLESIVDDASGEIIGRATQTLLKKGALDVAVIPAYTKKDRPAWIIEALCNPEDSAKLSSILMVEAGTLGVRYFTVPRYLAKRRIETKTLKIGEVEYKVRVKVSETPEGKVIRAKPEYKDLEDISDKTGLSLRRLQRMVEEDWGERKP
jgi:uncharacterized protein (TIGR00299 family) protein